MTDYLLDTNAIIAYTKQDARLLQIIRQATSVFLPVIALGEAYYGAENSQQVQQNTHNIEQIASIITILNCDKSTAKFYGRVSKLLRDKGRPIPHNDTWIAAIAFQHDLIVLTKDKHFSNIDNLKITIW